MSSYLVINDVEVWRSGTSGPPVTPVPTPPPSVPPASGPVFAFPEQALYPVPPAEISASGDAGLAIPFVSNAAIARWGILISIVDQKSQPNAKEMVISERAHDYTPAAPFGRIVAGGTGTLVLRFGEGSVTALNGDCALQPNRQYFLNMRDANTPRGTVSTHIRWDRRTDQ